MKISREWFIQHRDKLLLTATLAVILFITVIMSCYLMIEPCQKYVIDDNSLVHSDVGLVLGAGIAPSGKPYKELQARLDKAGEALRKGMVNKLILSGDNRFVNYDEPTAMKDYLLNRQKVPANKIFVDFAGRSTYESCERAAKIFGLKKTIIFSAGSHLPRAIYLCRHFGIESYGVSSGVEANNSTRRELLARVKAFYNTKLVGEPSVLGEPISVN